MESDQSAAAALQGVFRQGLALHQQGRVAEARSCYDEVLRRDPRHFDALYLLGVINLETAQTEAGVALIERAISVNPNVAAAHATQSVALVGLNRPHDAVASLDKAIALNPTFAEAYNNRGILLSQIGRHEDGLASLERAIALKPDNAEAHSNRGLVLDKLGRPEEALASLDRAIALKPDYAEAHYNRGLAFDHLLGPEAALPHFDRAIALNPNLLEAHQFRGVALHHLKRFEAALASYDRAIALKTDYLDALISRGHLLLQAGRFDAGWREFEWRKSRHPSLHRFDQGRPWRGEPDLDGKTIFVYHEEGLGDTIQFSRYLSLLRQGGANTVVSVQDPLWPLLRQLWPDVEVLGDDQRPSHFDYYCSLLSLPLAFGTSLQTIPSSPRYLSADAGRRARFEALLGPKTRPRIGLAWSGNPAQVNDRHRSIAFEQLPPLLSHDADWICLQNEIRPSDDRAFRECGRVGFLGGELKDFSDTAALTDLMDLVITVDTSIAHLAGALGKPVWILLALVQDWRWMTDRRDSPWYPSARLFRQPRFADWASVIEEVDAALRSELSGPR